MTEAQFSVPPARVFAVLSDPESYADWAVGSAQHPRRFVPARRRRLALPPSGRHGAADGKDQPKSCRLIRRTARSSARVRAPGYRKVEIVLEPRDGGTHVTMIEVAGDSLSKLALDRLTDPLVHHRNVESLRRLRRISEPASGELTGLPRDSLTGC